MELREFVLPSGRSLRVPTADEALRVKAFLIVGHGVAHAADVLSGIDDYYGDQRDGTDRDSLGVASQLARQLADPRPKDTSVTQELGSFRNLAPEWSDWRRSRRPVWRWPWPCSTERPEAVTDAADISKHHNLAG